MDLLVFELWTLLTGNSLASCLVIDFAVNKPANFSSESRILSPTHSLVYDTFSVLDVSTRF